MRQALITVLVLHWAVLLTPGANVLLVVHLASGVGRRAALGAACGITTAAVLWAVLAMLGVQALLDAHPDLRRGVELTGGTYLLVVAARLWRSIPGPEGVSLEAPSAWRGYRLGITTNLLNPKSALFFGSVFAAALPASHDIGLMVAAGMLVLINALAWHVALALFLSRLGARRWPAQHARWFARAGSLALALTAVRMLLTAFAEVRGID